ncbi:hypothetical protein INT44_004444 [Umbelopsis vinacea]|uniref:Uncharacterized protein n=1 Tax=Umbelopsis vinacea TaxID=44442 RepID=A0A8H7QAY7_9FUNG|nr:hypothetical protein INT44_004444 [Umbelopsis vinacea]
MSSHSENGTSAFRPEEAAKTTLDTPHPDQNRLSTEEKYRKASSSIGPHELEEQELANNADRELFYAMATRRLIFRNVLKVIAMIIMDVALPVLLYFVLKGPLGNPAYALLIGGVPALIMVIFKLVYSKSLDAIGILVFLAFLVSAIVAFASGDARILTFEKSIVTLILGVGFIITVLPIKFRSVRLKPFMLLVIKQLIPLGNINPSLVYGPANVASVEPVDQQYTNTTNAKAMNSIHPAEQELPNEKPNGNALGATPEENGIKRDSTATNNHDLETNRRSIRRRSRFNKYIVRQLFGDPTTGSSIDKYDWMFENSKRFRFDITFLTLWWGFILFLEFIIRLALVLSPISLDQVVTFANIAFGVICAVGGVVSIIYLFFRFKPTKAQVDERLREERLVDEEGMMLILAEEDFDM